VPRDLWLLWRWREREPPYRPRVRALDLDEHPCPVVSASGIAAAGHDGYELVDHPPAEAMVTVHPTRASVDKPPYRIPLMDEIRAVPWNGLRVASLFCGAGGSSTGYRMAGYRIVGAVEFVPAAADSYAANKADYTVLLREDVRSLTADRFLEQIGLERGELDILDGSPPCEPFSTAGRRDQTWREIREYSGQHQRTDDLFYEYARLVDGVRPRVFVAENVTGLIRGRAKGYFKRIMAALRACGYRVESRVLDAAWLGVPQSRRRVIIVGVREDLDAAPAWPSPLGYQYTVRDAIGDLLARGGAGLEQVRAGHGFQDTGHPLDEPSSTITGPDVKPRVNLQDVEVEQVYEGHGFETRGRSLDEPAVSVRSTPSAGAGGSHGHLQEVEVEQARLGRGMREEARSLDEPSATLSTRACHGGPGHLLEVGFYRDTGGQFGGSKTRDRIDEPCPTIIVGAHSAAAGHYQIDEPVDEPGLYRDTGGQNQTQAHRDRMDEPCPAITNGSHPGANAAHYQVEEFDEQTSGNDAFEPNFGTLDATHPTVTAEGARTSGELRSSRTRRRRQFTIAELRRICGFPDDYILTGSFGQQWERLGDAVPPPMAAAWARALADGPLSGGER